MKSLWQLTRYGPFDYLSFKCYMVTNLVIHKHLPKSIILPEIMDINSLFCLHSAPVSLCLVWHIWEWFHGIRLVFLFPKHTLHLKFLKSSPEKFEFKLGYWKWKNGHYFRPVIMEDPVLIPKNNLCDLTWQYEWYWKSSKVCPQSYPEAWLYWLSKCSLS